MKPTLSIKQLCAEAEQFAEIESIYDEPKLYGVTDGKAVGTYLEQKFTAYLAENYNYQPGNSASGIDLPDLEVDIKVTSVKQPQSSCPFKSATQKVFGLGYHLLVFVYDKYDDPDNRTGRLDMQHTIFIDKSRTADFQTTRGILDILNRDGNKDDILAFLEDRNLPVDEIGANQLADRILESPPNQGYLTISNALQWRLQYGRVIQQAGNVSGIVRVQ
ncbi:restriction endonuclease [Candidatus Synechococcus calcipolaris G9]|uniref:Restriction endonuclease n=1 Tax=Candidatus Synechococcus calcipolaris G9 TaxID=1497997 RepID=A0ABT6EWA8_9SYNE|nr:restriction endonuclease [Candidatus Synechococcus calcipolaris]MDG2990059.1 restriction endonuclease [Candidatus Synechococcus calcipolaris G9]